MFDMPCVTICSLSPQEPLKGRPPLARGTFGRPHQAQTWTSSVTVLAAVVIWPEVPAAMSRVGANQSLQLF